MRMAGTQLQSNSARVNTWGWHGLVRKHVRKIALGAGLGLSGIVANSQLGDLGIEIEKEVVVVGKDLMEAFTDDIKKEMGKEIIKLGKTLMNEQLKDENTDVAAKTMSTGEKVGKVVEERKENVNIVKKGLEEVNNDVKEMKSIEETTDI